jgi:hypothetical protein
MVHGRWSTLDTAGFFSIMLVKVEENQDFRRGAGF